MLYSRNSLHTPFAIRDKLFNIDFILFFSVLLLGIISIFAQYSSSGGVWESHSINHAIRFLVFFLYLDDNEGGSTIFPNHGIKSECKKGSVLMFPPLWPWLHAGEKPIDKSKYIHFIILY